MVVNINSDEYYMKRALEIAKGGWGRTNPNPLVGAVIVKNDEIISEGFHTALGCAHAEVEAFKASSESVDGCTLYVNLEPCSHYGRTPPCAKAIIESGVKRVVVSMVDPNPKVSGRGIQMIRDAGIEVVTGILEGEARKLNEVFIKFISKNRPFVIMKSAMTLDGKIASFDGDSKWISGEDSRKFVHEIRNRVSTVMVGINTVLRDNPSLTTRLGENRGKDAVRIVVDSKGEIPLESNVINVESKAELIIATTSKLDKEKKKALLEKGVRLVIADGIDGRVDLNILMEKLFKLDIDSVLLEGGGTLNSAALEAGIVDKVMLFIAPKIIGGEMAPTPVEGKGIKLMQDAIRMKDVSVSRFGDDVLIEAYVQVDS